MKQEINFSWNIELLKFDILTTTKMDRNSTRNSIQFLRMSRYHWNIVGNFNWVELIFLILQLVGIELFDPDLVSVE